MPLSDKWVLVFDGKHPKIILKLEELGDYI
jgi:hypothetical protein